MGSNEKDPVGEADAGPDCSTGNNGVARQVLEDSVLPDSQTTSGQIAE